MLPFTHSDRSSAYDFNFYQILATRFGKSEVAEPGTEKGNQVVEELRAMHDSAEYLLFAQSFFAMVQSACANAKTEMQASGPDAVIHRMPALISLVNCVGYLRGQDGFFLDDRPKPASDIQRHLYRMEDEAEKQLNELIELILAADGVKERYKERLTNYFVRSRSGEKPTTLW